MNMIIMIWWSSGVDPFEGIYMESLLVMVIITITFFVVMMEK